MEKYIPISFDILLNNLNEVENIELFIKGERGLKKIKEKGKPLSNELKAKLAKFKKGKQNKVLVKTESNAVFNLCNVAIQRIIQSRERPERIIREIFSILNTMYDALVTNPVKENFTSVSSANEKVSRFIENNPQVTKLTISTLKKDTSTSIHTINVQKLVSGFAHFIGMRGTKLKIFVDGSFFHDIGKIKIPDNILKKPGRLTDEEFEIMKKHTLFGYEILIENDLKKYSKMALEHHEFMDGSGYPNGIKGEDISEYAKIVQICDIFEALTGIRPYKKPFEIFNALELMKKEFVDKGKIDKELFEEFLNFLKINKESS